MPVLTQLKLNIGTEQNPNMVLHDLHDIRISSTDVTTVTRLLGCDAGVNSIAPLTLANAASLLGVVNTKISSGTIQVDSEGSNVSIYIAKDKRYFVVVTERGSNKYVVGIVFNKDLSSYGNTVIVSNEGLIISGSSGSGEWVENPTPNAIINFLLIEF
jgi:hypothetical protein